jgi:hypothetical protein
LLPCIDAYQPSCSKAPVAASHASLPESRPSCCKLAVPLLLPTTTPPPPIRTPPTHLLSSTSCCFPCVITTVPFPAVASLGAATTTKLLSSCWNTAAAIRAFLWGSWIVAKSGRPENCLMSAASFL